MADQYQNTSQKKLEIVNVNKKKGQTMIFAPFYIKQVQCNIIYLIGSFWNRVSQECAELPLDAHVPPVYVGFPQQVDGRCATLSSLLAYKSMLMMQGLLLDHFAVFEQCLYQHVIYTMGMCLNSRHVSEEDLSLIARGWCLLLEGEYDPPEPLKPTGLAPVQDAQAFV